jgi:hypothetical protein
MSESSSTPDDAQQFVGTDLSSLCSLLNRPLILTGVFRDILARHFADAGYIEEPDLKHLIWKSGEDTNILIESIHRWRPELTEHRPAVIIKRNAYQNVRKGIGDMRQGPPADGQGHPHYVTFWTGSHTLFCIGGTGAQAELLGTEVQRELTEFGPEIARALGLTRFNVTQVGAVAELEEAQENFTVPVTVGYTYEERWRLRKQAPLLHSVSLSMIFEC